MRVARREAGGSPFAKGRIPPTIATYRKAIGAFRPTECVTTNPWGRTCSAAEPAVAEQVRPYEHVADATPRLMTIRLPSPWANDNRSSDRKYRRADAVQFAPFSLAGTSASMIEPKRVLRALAEHWTLLEPLCERFDAGTLSLVELRHQLAAQLDECLAYLRRVHRLGWCLEIEAYLRHLERLAGHILDAFEIRDGNDLARQLRLLDMRVRDVLKKLDNDEQALVAVADRAKTSDRQIPLRQRYAEVLATWDEYVEPMIQLVAADGAFEQGVHRVEQVLMKLLGEQQRLGQLVDDDLLLRTHARILEMQTTAQLTLRKARELLLPLREEARRHNAVT